MRECLTFAQSSTTWFVSTLFKLTALCSHRLHPYHPSPVCKLPALEQKLLHSLLGIHPPQHSPLFSLSILHTFCGNMGTLCIKDRYTEVPLSAAFQYLSLYVTAAPAKGRTWIRSQLLPTPLITISQLSTLLFMVGKWKHFYLPDTPSFRDWDDLNPGINQLHLRPL